MEHVPRYLRQLSSAGVLALEPFVKQHSGMYLL